MAKEGTGAAGGGDTAVGMLQKIYLLIDTAVKKSQSGPSTGAGGAAGGAAGVPGASPQSDESHRRNFWQTMSGMEDPRKARNAVIAGAAGGVLGAVGSIAAVGLGGAMDPFKTKQEASIGTERAGIQATGGLIGGAIGAFAGAFIGNPLLGGAIGGSIGSSVGGAIAGSHGKEAEQVIGEAKGGFADLRELAKAGYKIDDATMQRRAEYERGAAQRGANFDKRVAGAVETATSDALGGSGTDSIIALLRELIGVTKGEKGGKPAAANQVADTVNRRGS